MEGLSFIRALTKFHLQILIKLITPDSISTKIKP